MDVGDTLTVVNHPDVFWLFLRRLRMGIDAFLPKDSMKFCTLKLELKAMVRIVKVSSACNFSSEAIYPKNPTPTRQGCRSVSKLTSHAPPNAKAPLALLALKAKTTGEEQSVSLTRVGSCGAGEPGGAMDPCSRPRGAGWALAALSLSQNRLVVACSMDSHGIGLGKTNTWMFN